MKKRKLFCQLSPVCYKISLKKEYLLRDVKDLLGREIFASQKAEPFPVLVKAHSSEILRKLSGVDMELQRNKAVNLKLAGDKINGVVINRSNAKVKATVGLKMLHLPLHKRVKKKNKCCI